MLSKDSSQLEPERDEAPDLEAPATPGETSPNIQVELDRLEEMILDRPRVPLTRITLVDEEQLLDQLDLIRLNLPADFQQAREIVAHQEEMLLEAQEYAREVVEDAQREANRLLDEMGIVRQAKHEAERVREQVQQDCDAAREQTLEEIESWRQQVREEIEQMRARALLECDAIEAGADEYADRILANIDMQLSEMLRIVRNGRQQLESPIAHNGNEGRDASPANTGQNGR